MKLLQQYFILFASVLQTLLSKMNLRLVEYEEPYTRTILTASVVT